MWPAEESWAGRLTVRSARPLDRTGRMGIRRRIEALDARPAMPPAALLFIRQLSVEAPSGSTRGAGFEHGVRDRLAHLYAAAARPAAGQVDAAAEAVVFPDEATMLACLLADIRRGCAAGHWWWQAVWQRMGLELRAGAILDSRPEQVPAVFQVLDRMGEAVPVVASLEREQAVSIVRAMLASHGAPELARAFDTARRPVDSIGGTPRPPVPEASARDVGPGLATVPSGLPRLPRGSESLPPENRVLVALSLGLAAVPQVMRSAQFAVRAGKWLKRELSGVVVAPPFAATARSTDADHDPAAGSLPSKAVEGAPGEREMRTGLALPRMRGPAAFGGDPQLVGQSPEISSPAAPPEVEAEAHTTDRSNTAPSILSDESTPAPPPHLHAGVRTRLGGALYLIGAFERLGIPDCFEPTWPFGACFSRWGVLELVARGLVSTAGLTETCREDPLWSVLAQIDGRDAGLFAFQDFPARHAFHVPSGWLPEILDRTEGIVWATRQRRIAVWSRAGWILADRRLVKGERLDDAINTEIPLRSRIAVSGAEQLRWAESPHTRLGAELQIAPALKFWLECMLPALRVWLGRAMGLDRPDFAALVESLLLVPGDLFVTSTRVDFRAPIDQSRIPVRRAALDLDPGWLPAWGRSIRFHYGDVSGGFR